jgi:hypothetical protein
MTKGKTVIGPVIITGLCYVAFYILLSIKKFTGKSLIRECTLRFK